MDKQLLAVLAQDENRPVFNPDTCNGLATREVPKLEDWVDRIIRHSLEGIDGLSLDKSYRCSPKEELAVSVKLYGRNTYNLARSDVYMRGYKFSMRNPDGTRTELKTKYWLFPSVRNGMITLRGVQFKVKPVLVDGVFSPENNQIYMHIEKDRIEADRRAFSIMIDGECKINYVVISALYRMNESAKSRYAPRAERTKCESALLTYLFAKYGVKEVFRKYANADIRVGTKDINPTDYKPSEWVICQSTGNAPFKSKKHVETSPVRIAVRRKEWNEHAELLATSMFYALDHFPDFKAEHLDSVESWTLTLAHIIFKSNETSGVLMDYMARHFVSIESLMDPTLQAVLLTYDVKANDIYDLLYHLAESISRRLLDSDPGNMYRKRFSVNNYVGYTYRCAVTKLQRQLTGLRKEMTPRVVEEYLRDCFRTEAILSLHDGAQFLEVVSNPNEMLIPKVTALICDQESAKSSGGNKVNPTNMKAKHRLHSSTAECASFGVLPKSSPTHRTSVNPNLEIDESGAPVAKYRHITDPMQENYI